MKLEKRYALEAKNRGITLIALIITIIVLLILAGVTINLTLGENGIFRTAENAGKNYMDAQERELAEIANFTNALNDILGSTGGNDTDAPGTNYELLKSVAEVGDYVKYDTGISSVGENGIVTFRVLYNDDTYGLQIISDKNIEQVKVGADGTDNLTAWEASMNDYNNAITTLNEKAEYYAQSSPYALDGRCVGSVPTIGVDGKFNAKNTEVEGTLYIPDDYTIPTGWSSRDTGCEKLEDTNYTTDQTAMETSNIYITGENYWLASRAVVSDSTICNVRVRSIDTSGNFYVTYVCRVFPYGTAYSAAGETGLRPCISLNPNVKVISGDGKTEETGYVLGI